VSAPEVLLSHEQMQGYKVGYPDANLVAVKDSKGFRFWMDGSAGKIEGIPGRPWSFMTGGKRLSDGVKSLTSDNVKYWESYKCPTFNGCKNESLLVQIPATTRCILK